MFRQYRFIVALVIIGLVGGAFGHQVDAAANAEDSNTINKNEKINLKQDHQDRWEMIIQKCFGNWYVKENQQTTENPNESTEQNVDDENEKAEQVQQEDKPGIEKEEEQQQEQEQVEQKPNDQVDSALHPFEQQVFELTNAERVQHGLAPLQLDTELSKVSRDKSKDMLDNNYFAHDSPTFGSPFDMMRAYGIDYRTAGENIAKGQRSAEEVVNAWMNSPGHRENILNSNFTHIGVGYVEQGNIWTQQFIGK